LETSCLICLSASYFSARGSCIRGQQFSATSDDERGLILTTVELPGSFEAWIIDQVRIVILGNRVY
jgi:hypothetical protein